MSADRHDASEGARPGVVPWLDRRLPVASLVRREFIAYQVPANLNWLWNVGGCVTATLALLVVSGFFLALCYVADPALAFDAVETIDRRIPWGWLVRALHMAGASAIFAGLYIHIWRSLYYGSYKRPRELVWLTGTTLLLVVMATAFLGYTLPYGQMSYWGLVVASHAIRSLPLIGDGLAAIAFGPEIGGATLRRAFAFHFLLGGAAVAVVLLHVAALHVAGSNNPEGVDPPRAGMQAFAPHHASRVAIAAASWLLVVAVLALLFPSLLTAPENYLAADPARTPSSILPEWYFLPYYAILRAIPGVAGVLLSIGSVLILFALPWLDRDPRRALAGRTPFRAAVLALIPVMLLLGIAGLEQTQGAWLYVARAATLWWFAHFLVLLPLLGRAARA